MRAMIVAFVLLQAMLIFGSAAADRGPKVEVCHSPPDNPENILILSLPARSGAVAEHLSHGDWPVTAEVCDSIADNNCDGSSDPIADDADCEELLFYGATCDDGTCTVDPEMPVGMITADILRAADRGVESSAVNLVADSRRWATLPNGADLALMIPGGVRADLYFASSAVGEGDGVVTLGEAFTVQPFGNGLLTLPMTGAEIISALEDQCQPVGAGTPFLLLGVSEGFTYDLAVTIETNECTAIAISNVMLNGAPLEPAATYSVTVDTFMASGGDNFPTFAAIDPTTGIEGVGDLEALVTYLGTLGPLDPPSTDRINVLVPTLEFAVDAVAVNESAGTATLNVTRTNGLSGAVSVDYATAAGTAASGSDFTAQSGTLSWADGDGAAKSIEVPIIDDSDVEGSESFTVMLSNPSAPAVLGARTIAAVTIDDNDGPQ